MATRRGVMSARLWRAMEPGQNRPFGVGPTREATVSGNNGSWDRHLAEGSRGESSADLSAGGAPSRVWSGLWDADPHHQTLRDGDEPRVELTAAALQEQTALAAAHLAARGVGP